MDIKDLKTLIKVVTDTDITEFEIENADEKIVIKRGTNTQVVQVASPQQFAPQTPAAAPAPVAAGAGTAVSAPAAAAKPVNDKYETITSPIVGTFYCAPSPESDPYVKVGSAVEAGQTLCIVEAMKLMNEIEADFKCKIIEILKENAQAVEFGDPLFVVEKL